jgi:hypothetical protein
MAIHHVNMNPIRSASLGFVDLIAQAREIC